MSESGTHTDRKFVAIWQSKDPHEYEWICEIFGDLIREHVFDGRHEYVCDNALLIDAFILTTPMSYYQKFAGRDSFLIHLLDENYDGGYERYRPFSAVFRKHWASAFASNRVHRLPLGYSNGFAAPDHITPASERSYLWSFVGAANKSSRPGIFPAMGRLSPYKICISDDFVAPSNLKVERGRVPPPQVARLLQDSAFAPSPMGNVNIECYRTYEALEAGAIPLVERRWTLDYYKELFGDNPLPAFRSWRKAAAFVDDIGRRPAQLDELQATCVDWWNKAKQTYRDEVKMLIGEATSDSGNNDYAILDRVMSKKWQYSELLRHQTASTLRLRLVRQARRLLSTGKWRVSHGK